GCCACTGATTAPIRNAITVRPFFTAQPSVLGTQYDSLPAPVDANFGGKSAFQLVTPAGAFRQILIDHRLPGNLLRICAPAHRLRHAGAHSQHVAIAIEDGPVL